MVPTGSRSKACKGKVEGPEKNSVFMKGLDVRVGSTHLRLLFLEGVI